MDITGYQGGTPERANMVWHRDFWKLNAVVLAMSLAVYMQLPVLPEWMAESALLGADRSTLVVGIYCAGLFSLGAVCSYLIQRYRRNKVCMLSMLIVAACVFCATYLRDNMGGSPFVRQWAVAIAAALRFAIGAFFGLATMILNSTLIVDNCDSPHRDLANVVSAWIQRLAILVGPMLSLALRDELGFSNAMYTSAALCVVAVLTLASVSFPFKAPEETCHVISLDRFLMLRGMPVAQPLLLLAMALGVVIAAEQNLPAYAALLCGFALASLWGFRRHGVRASLWQVAAGYAVALCGVVAACAMARQSWAQLAALLLVGAGVATALSRYHVYLLDVAGHCQRGSAQSTFMLTFDCGVAAGVAVALLPGIIGRVGHCSLAVGLLVASVAYLPYTMRWVARKLATGDGDEKKI